MRESFPATNLSVFLEFVWVQLTLKIASNKSDNTLNFISLFLMLNFVQK